MPWRCRCLRCSSRCHLFPGARLCVGFRPPLASRACGVLHSLAVQPAPGLLRCCTSRPPRGLTSRSRGPPASCACRCPPPFGLRRPLNSNVGRSRGKARESSLRSRPSASSSGEAAALRSASGGSVFGADAVAPLPVVLVLRPHRRARLRRGAVGGVLARGLVAFPVSSGYPLDYSPNPALQGTLRDKAAQRP